MARESFLTDLCRAGKPLVELTASVAPGQTMEGVIEAINALGPDIEASGSGWNAFSPAAPIVSIDATREALERLFGWQWVRVPARAVPNVPMGFHWREVTPLQFFPPSLAGRITSIGISDPGANDDGQDDLVRYELPDGTGRIITGESGLHDLWRQDDNGHRFLVRTFSSRAEALAAVHEFESHGHRQVYWVERHETPGTSGTSAG